MEDANFATGDNGLIAVDKIGNQILFLDPRTCATTRSRLMHLHRVFTSWRYWLTIGPPMFRSMATESTARIHTLVFYRRVRSGGQAALWRFQHLPVSRTARSAMGPAGSAVLRV